MAIEFCPKCLAPRSTVLSTSRRETVDRDGETKTIETRSYHCDVCHSFVRSEEIELAAGGSDRAA